MTFMKDISQRRSKKILVDFMEVSSMNFYTKNKFIDYYNKVSRIQQMWINIRSNNQRRYELLIKLWDREIDESMLK